MKYLQTLTLSAPIPQNGQTHSNNLPGNSSVLDVWQGSEYASTSLKKLLNLKKLTTSFKVMANLAQACEVIQTKQLSFNRSLYGRDLHHERVKHQIPNF